MTWSTLGDLSTGVIVGAVLGLLKALPSPRLRYLGLWLMVGWTGVLGLLVSLYVRGIV